MKAKLWRLWITIIFYITVKESHWFLSFITQSWLHIVRWDHWSLTYSVAQNNSPKKKFLVFVPANSFAYHKGIAHVWKSRQTFWWIERIYTIYSYGQQVFMVWKTMYNSQGNNNCIPLIIFLTIVYCPTPTCKPNSASVGWSRSWLCFPTEEGRKEEEGRKKEGTHT